jgi:hypothetical protein
MSPHRRAFAYVGNRGIVLGLLGIIWVLSGVGAAVDPQHHPGLLHELIPAPVWFALWFVPGFVAILAVLVKPLDEWAWGLLILPVAIRFLSFTAGWAFGTYPPGWRGAITLAASALLVNRCAAGLDRPAPWDGRERREWTAERQ